MIYRLTYIYIYISLRTQTLLIHTHTHTKLQPTSETWSISVHVRMHAYTDVCCWGSGRPQLLREQNPQSIKHGEGGRRLEDTQDGSQQGTVEALKGTRCRIHHLKTPRKSKTIWSCAPKCPRPSKSVENSKGLCVYFKAAKHLPRSRKLLPDLFDLRPQGFRPENREALGRKIVRKNREVSSLILYI